MRQEQKADASASEALVSNSIARWTARRVVECRMRRMSVSDDIGVAHYLQMKSHAMIASVCLF